MKKNHKLVLFLITFGFILATSTVITVQTFTYFDNPAMNSNFQNLNLSGADYSNATVISDGYGGLYWNDGNSIDPDIAVDDSGGIHVVWQDGTSGVWGTDGEIMYASYTEADGWSNATVISDGFGGIYWNDGGSFKPEIAVDSNNTVHVVWWDLTSGVWGTDGEIMYASYTEADGWSNVTVISDGYAGVYWNDGSSDDPDIAADDSGGIHVVWWDDTSGVWGTDPEIMYISYTEADGWSNVTVISDGYAGVYWNDGISYYPDIAVDDSEDIHVVWKDSTRGVWGGGPSDTEIMYVSYTEADGWSNATVISDGYGGLYWNDGFSSHPNMAIDDSEGIHVVWWDNTNGRWIAEIMYASYTEATGWSNITVISEGYSDIYGDIYTSDPDIAVNSSGNIHVVWEDWTDGVWGTDTEIMYANYTEANGWSNPTVISDDYLGTSWNDGQSYNPKCVSYYDKLYVVWWDTTDGVWGTDAEIMFTSLSIPASPITTSGGIPFGDLYLIIVIICTIGLIVYVKRKL